MSTPIQRRAFLATTALAAAATPSLALAGARIRTATLDGQFEDSMMQCGQHLKTMRARMRSLNNPGARADAIFYANQLTFLLAQCLEHAGDVPIPEHSAEKYKGDHDRFVTDLRLRLSESIATANDLTRALLTNNDDEANALYNTLKRERNEGHDEFEA